MRFTHDGPLFCTAFRHLGQSPRKELLMDADTINRHLCDVFCNHCFCRSVAEPKVISVAL